MLEWFKEVYYVSWSDLRFMRHNIFNVVIMSLMSPILYVIAFGYGLGNSAVMDGVPYIAFMIPGIVSLSTLSSSFTSTSTRINVQRLYYRNFDEMLMCPLHYSAIVMGKSMLGTIRGLISCAVIYILGMCLTDQLQVTPMFILVVVLSCFTYSCLGLTAALLANSHQSMATFNTLVILPMTFLCGTFFSTASLPNYFQVILYCIPLTHTSDCVRAAALGWAFPWASLAVIAIFTVAFFWLNMYLIKTRRV
jgi:ABC-2 type transport system permease protein